VNCVNQTAKSSPPRPSAKLTTFFINPPLEISFKALRLLLCPMKMRPAPAKEKLPKVAQGGSARN